MQSVYGNQRDTVPVYLSKPRRNPFSLLLQYDWHYAIWARRFICGETIYSAAYFALCNYRFDSLLGARAAYPRGGASEAAATKVSPEDSVFFLRKNGFLSSLERRLLSLVDSVMLSLFSSWQSRWPTCTSSGSTCMAANIFPGNRG